MTNPDSRPAAAAAAPVAAKPARPKATRRAAAAPADAAKPAASPAAKKPAAKPSAKAAAAKPVEKPSAKAVAKVPRKATPEPAPVPRAVLVRDSFTMPEADYALLAALKQRLLKAGHEAKKSELLRAALVLLAALGDAELLKAAQSVPRLATGRPKHKAKAKGKH